MYKSDVHKPRPKVCTRVGTHEGQQAWGAWGPGGVDRQPPPKELIKLFQVQQEETWKFRGNKHVQVPTNAIART